MNILPLLIPLLVVGCATTEELIVEAKECVANHVSAQGVIGKPSNEERKICWTVANKRLESIEKLKQRRAKARSERCLPGQIKVCRVYSSKDKMCVCASSFDIQR